MKKIGLTGNIGSGKTTIAKIFSILGAPIYHADMEAKKFLQREDIVQELVQRFGNQILKNNQIDRKFLASIVFNNHEALSYLNKLIHPLVKEDFENWCKLQNNKPQYIIQETAILFESNFDKYVDHIITVSAPENIRMKRIMKRDHLSEDEIIKRMSNQWNEEEKKRLSDYIIINDDRHLVISQVIAIDKRIKSN